MMSNSAKQGMRLNTAPDQNGGGAGAGNKFDPVGFYPDIFHFHFHFLVMLVMLYSTNEGLENVVL